MGDRVSISYKKDDEESATLYSHWGGFKFAQEALRHAKAVATKRQANREGTPLDRLEPATMLVDFIRASTKDMQAVKSDLYLPNPPDRGDNIDNGHFTINLDTMELEK